MALCSGIKADGGRCKAQAIRDSEWCFSHHPDYEQARQRRASKGGKRGGRGRPQLELTNIKTQLQDLADGVLDGQLERSTGSAVAQILNVLLRAVSVELQVKEQLELVERLEALEGALEERKVESRYG